jgi:branched-subunit amino acid transport protein
MTADLLQTTWRNPWLIITLAALASYASRGLGALLSGRIHADSAIIEWITAVTYALMAGLVARMVVLPIGALAATPDWQRLSAAGVCLAVFFISRKNVGLGVLAGSLTLLALSGY